MLKSDHTVFQVHFPGFPRTTILFLPLPSLACGPNLGCSSNVRISKNFQPFPKPRRQYQSVGSIDSGYCEILARCGRSLHVGPHRFPTRCATQPSLTSWEFFTTLDYEWRVIRGCLPYRWTILVRRWFPLQSVLCCDLWLIWPFHRFTHSHVWLLSSA